MTIMRQIKVKGVVLPGWALAGQERRHHMKERENGTLDIFCREWWVLSNTEYQHIGVLSMH